MWGNVLLPVHMLWVSFTYIFTVLISYWITNLYLILFLLWIEYLVIFIVTKIHFIVRLTNSVYIWLTVIMVVIILAYTVMYSWYIKLCRIYYNTISNVTTNNQICYYFMMNLSRLFILVAFLIRLTLSHNTNKSFAVFKLKSKSTYKYYPEQLS